MRLYLEAIAGDASPDQLLELRRRVGPQQLRSEFFSIADRERLVAAIASHAAAADVYVGCAPRVRRAGGKDAVKEVWTLWAECDGASSSAAALAHDPAPAVVVASGSGTNVHAYWPLERALTPHVAEQANYRLAHLLGADLVCYDAARILRPPGTWNHKHLPARPVELRRITPGLRYSLAEVLKHVPLVSNERVNRRWEDRAPRGDRGRDPLLRIPPKVYFDELLGLRAARNGKVRCPFHPDEPPSLHVYPSATRGWSCFSCGRGGSIYDLAAGLWGMQTRGAEFLRLRSLLLERFSRELNRLGPARTR